MRNRRSCRPSDRITFLIASLCVPHSQIRVPSVNFVILTVSHWERLFFPNSGRRHRRAITISLREPWLNYSLSLSEHTRPPLELNYPPFIAVELCRRERPRRRRCTRDAASLLHAVSLHPRRPLPHAVTSPSPNDAAFSSASAP